ncbi:efflux RND transporter periplasmic adaptor subunit [Litorimonas haliclonae]|uniref:efflux RND transporter periplasmic adaptor subunit n=1 Tax=Litorimonas haliclonae TaxID=2081977 RepID=UPI0039EE7E80
MKRNLLLSAAFFTTALFLTACSGDVDGVKKRSAEPEAVSSQQADQHADDDHGNETHSDEYQDDDHADDSHSDDEHGDEDEGSDIVKLSDEESREAGIVISQASMGQLGQTISLPAEVRFDADRVANVSPKVSGIVAKLYKSEGDTVKRGDTLALISSRELAGLKAQWLKAQTQSTLAAKALEREEKLFAERITAEADVQAARANFEALKAAKDAAENELHAAGVSHSALDNIATANDGDNANSFLSAPISGTVVRRDVMLGETVSAGDAGVATLFTIADDNVVWADIGVYKQDISRIREQAPVVLKSDEGTILAESSVAFILPIINETSRTATARVILDNPNGNLRPGQFVTADISVGESQVVLRVPLASVQTVEKKASVFVPVEGGFAPQNVTIGSESGGYVEIRSGLRAGDRFVSEGAFTLKAQLEKDAFGDDHGH